MEKISIDEITVKMEEDDQVLVANIWGDVFVKAGEDKLVLRRFGNSGDIKGEWQTYQSYKTSVLEGLREVQARIFG